MLDLSSFKCGHDAPILLPTWRARKAFVAGKSADSALVKSVARLVEDDAMPPEGKGKPLTAEQIGLIRAWIDQGAK